MLGEITFIEDGMFGYPELRMLVRGTPHRVSLDQPPSLKITDIEYLNDQGYPLLKLKLNGRGALISLEQKAGLIMAGLISVGDSLDGVLPQIRIINPGKSMDNTLKGCSGDPNLIREFIKFAEH